MAKFFFLSRIKKASDNLSGALELSYLDSNQDKLIQSQMCYRYTIGQSVCFLSKTGAKVQRFYELTKFFLDDSSCFVVLLLIIRYLYK